MLRGRIPALPAPAVTPGPVYRARRRLVAALAATPALALPGCRGEPPPPVDVPRSLQAEAAGSGDAFRTTEAQTRYEDATTYNNFYEFGSGKADPSRAAKTLVTSPWSVQVSGACARPGSVPLESLLAGIAEEERIYRMRCVEGCSMVIPLLGVPLNVERLLYELSAYALSVTIPSL